MKLLRLLSVCCALSMSGVAVAASLFVKPTTLVLGPGESAASITVTNNGDAPVTAQVRVFAWDQAANEDQLTQTDALAASPPMLTVAPGQSQTVRLVRVSKTGASKEESYRLLVDEIADRAAPTSTGIALQLRYSVPVFVMPKPRDGARLTFTAEWAVDGLVIGAANRGGSHAQISNVSMRYADGSSVVVNDGLIGYVLPAKSRQWTLALPVETTTRGRPTSVRAVVNGQELSVQL